MPAAARKVLPQGAVLAAGRPGWQRLTALGQAQPAGLRVTAQVTGKFLQLVPFAAHLGVLAGEGDSPGGLTSNGSATGAVQHQIGGARGTPRVDHEAIRMMIKPIQVTTVIIDKTLHAAHHPRCGNALSCRNSRGRMEQ